MKKIVLTGAATDPSGTFVKRDDLIATCRRAGIYVQKGFMRDTDALVASRHDTRKSTVAARRNIAVVTYADLYREIEARTGRAA